MFDETIMAAYAKYDSDERVNGPDDFEAFSAAVIFALDRERAAITQMHQAVADPALSARCDRVTYHLMWLMGEVHEYGPLDFQGRLMRIHDALEPGDFTVAKQVPKRADGTGEKAPALAIAWPLVDPDLYAAADKEEFVLVWPKQGLRAKVKFIEYERLHGLLTGMSAKDIWSLLRQGRSVDELRINVPDEFLAWVDEQEEAIQDRFTAIADECERDSDRLRALHSERKDFALAVQDHPYRSILFRMFADGQVPADLIWRLIEPERSLPFWNRERSKESG